MEGINWGGTDHTYLGDTNQSVNYTDHALFGGDVNFATSVYRHNVYRGFYTGDQSYSSTYGYNQYYPNDWVWNYTSFMDRVHISDTLPWCQPDDDLAYYGFLSTGLHFQNGVLKHLKDYDRAVITFTTKQWDAQVGADGQETLNSEGFRVYGENAAAARTFEVRQDGVYVKNADHTWTQLSNKGLAFMTTTGGGYIQFARAGEDPHKSIVDFKAAHSDGVVEIPLNTNEFIATYDINLGPYYGNGDITAEAAKGSYLEVDRDGGSGTIDVQLLGRPYIYKGQKHPNISHNGCSDKADALNHVGSRYYNFNYLSKAVNNYVAADPAAPIQPTPSGVHQGASAWRASSGGGVEHRNNDTAYFLGYLIPFGYDSWLTVNKNGNEYHSLNHPDVTDYGNDNLTPTVVRYETRFRNINDKTEDVDDENRAAHISQVRLRTSWNPGFTTPNTGSADALRLQNIYVPAQFVPVGGHTRDANWFQAQDFKFTVYNVATGTTATVALSWTDLVNLGMLSGTVTGSGTSAAFKGDTSGNAYYPDCYVIDVEKYLRLTEIKQQNPDLSAADLFTKLSASHGLNIAGRSLADGETEADAQAAVINLIQGGIVGHYNATDRTNTLRGAFVGDESVDLEYAAPYVTSVEFLYLSPAANREKPETMLDSGQWLGANRVRDNISGTNKTPDYAHNFAFAYDGVYADREVEDFTTAEETGVDLVKGNWNYWSTPTFDKQGNAMGGMRTYQNLTVSDVLTRDPNKKTLVKNESNTRGYDLSHQLAVLDTDMQRGKQVFMNGSSQKIFAYDADEYSASSPWSYAPDATTSTNGNGVPNGDLYAGDYVEYHLYVGSGKKNASGTVEPVRTDLTYASSDSGTPFELNPLPLEHVDARFEVQKGQRIVGWEVEKYYDETKKTWVEANTAAQGTGAILPVTATLSDAAGTTASVVQPQMDLSQAEVDEDGARTFGSGAEQYDGNRNITFTIGDAYEPSKNNGNSTSQISVGRGVWIRVITQVTDELETDEAYNSTENQTNRNDHPSYQGTSLQANFYAIAAPLHGFAQYRTVNHSGSGGGNNRATADYATDSSELGYIARAHSTGVGVADNCADNNTLLTYSFDTAKDVRFDGYQQLAARDHSNVVFHRHVKEILNTNRDDNRVAITPEFWDPATKTLNPYSASGQLANADGNRMRLRVTNIRNTTWHESTMTVTVSFMRGVVGTGVVQGAYGDSTDGFDAQGNPAGKRYFELTSKPTYVADETVPELGYPQASVTAAEGWKNTTPAKVLGLTGATTAAQRERALLPDSVNLDQTDETGAVARPDVKIEYYVPNWHGSDTPATVALESRVTVTPQDATGSNAGAWVSYEELEAKYKNEDAALTPEAHTSNGNIFRDVTGVRITYYDIPATADGTTAFPLDDVSLLGVARYQDTRLDTTAVNHRAGEQENLWTPYGQVDVAFTHTDRQNTVLDFVDLAKSNAQSGSKETPVLKQNTPVQHETLLTKQDEGKRAPLTIWRRTPVMQFQNQVFQTQKEAEAIYNAEANQKTSYVAGEQLWYKNTLTNVPKRTNYGITTLEGELYNPVFYELIPTEYLKADGDKQITAEWLAQHLTVKWYENLRTREANGAVAHPNRDVYDERTNGMKLIVVPVETYRLPDYGGAMIYTNTASETGGGHGNYFADLDPRATLANGVKVSQETPFTLFKICWIPLDEALPEGAALVKETAAAGGVQGGSVVDSNLQYDRPVDAIMPNFTRMEVGDRIEVSFDIYASIDNLPQVYQRNGYSGDRLTAPSALGQSVLDTLEPAYFPRVGEYYYTDYWHEGSGWTGHVSPLTNNGDQQAGTTNWDYSVRDSWGGFRLSTENVVMDMDYLMLDSAFSGDKPEQTDTWEMFDGSYTYIPGEGRSYGQYSSGWNINGWGMNGMGVYAYPYSTNGSDWNYHSNINSSATSATDGMSLGYLLDTDMKTSNNKQIVRYTPRPEIGTKATVESQLPADTHYVWWYDGSNGTNQGGSSAAAENNIANGAGALRNVSRYVRDWYGFVTKSRINDTEKQHRWLSDTPLVWSETRLHMDKAWLATSSRFISGDTATAGSGVADYEVRRYYNSEDSHAGWATGTYDYSAQHYRDHRGVFVGQYTTALQYNQDFVSELTAYNYGDRNLDGVEFTYVMPRGVEPILDGTITNIPGDDDSDLEEDTVTYTGQVSMTVTAPGLEDPSRIRVGEGL